MTKRRNFAPYIKSQVVLQMLTCEALPLMDNGQGLQGGED